MRDSIYAIAARICYHPSDCAGIIEKWLKLEL